MPGKVTISDLRNIKRMEFDIPDRGVWVLTAGNGGGKSSLLACLRRIGYRLAFPVHFPTSQRSSRLDNFENASVNYELNQVSVTYAYSGTRWVPTPKRNANLFQKFGYADVVYIGATAERITPKPGDFDPTKVRKAETYLIDNANNIFDTDRFSNLKRVNLTRGQWNRAFVMAHDDSRRTYHSEAHFSMGELCVLNLLGKIADCPNNSLLLIDELELAIHPKAQIRLLDYLKLEAKRKELTIIFSTHSVTILKSIDKKNLICLKEESGVISPVYGCYPTYALGFIASDEERSCDIFVYVEDENALLAAEPCIKLAISRKYSDGEVFPSVKILPIGSFISTMNFLKLSAGTVARHVKQYALLDEDVESETLKDCEKNGDSQRIAEYNKIKDNVRFLPWVPEVYACFEIVHHAGRYREKLRQKFMSQQIAIDVRQFDGLSQLNGQEQRTRAKVLWKQFVNDISGTCGCTADELSRYLFEEFAARQFEDRPGDMMQAFGPIVA